MPLRKRRCSCLHRGAGPRRSPPILCDLGPAREMSRRTETGVEGERPPCQFICLTFREELGARPDEMNPNGGMMAMGHAFGATGAILITVPRGTGGESRSPLRHRCGEWRRRCRLGCARRATPGLTDATPRDRDYRHRCALPILARRDRAPAHRQRPRPTCRSACSASSFSPPHWQPSSTRCGEVLRLGVTLVHELGHAFVGMLVGRRFTGFVLRGDMSGHAVTVGPPRGIGRLVTTWAGYPMPGVVALGLVAAASQAVCRTAADGASRRFAHHRPAGAFPSSPPSLSA